MPRLWGLVGRLSSPEVLQEAARIDSRELSVTGEFRGKTTGVLNRERRFKKRSDSRKTGSDGR